MYTFLLEAGAPATQGGGMSLISQFLPFVFIAAIFYFLIIRPQQKKQKEHQAMIEAVAINDEVFTSGGLKGKVANIKKDKNIIVLRVDDTTGTKIEFQRSAIAAVISKAK
ncbi:MAG: preprotein translocase subunit YajC [Candidatus Cloacimonadales bacterium]